MNLQEAKPYIYARFKPLPPLTETEIAAFERRCQIELPSEYREFLLEIGNGSVRDEHARMRFPLYKLEEGGHTNTMETAFNWEKRLKTPFPFENTVDTYEEVEALCGESSSPPGIKYFFHEGCGYMYFIVITGKMRGTVWLDGTVSDYGFQLLRDSDTGAPVSFLDWFKWWDDSRKDDETRYA